MDVCYDPGGLGAARVISLLDDRIRVHSGRRRSREVLFDDIRSLRYFTTASPQRSDYTLLIEGPRRTLSLNYLTNRLSGADPIREASFNHAIAKTLSAIAIARPDLDVISGRAALPATLIFLCFALPGALALAAGYLFLGEPGMLQPGLGALGVGLVSLVFAWSARPWKKAERIPVSSLAEMFGRDEA